MQKRGNLYLDGSDFSEKFFLKKNQLLHLQFYKCTDDVHHAPLQVPYLIDRLNKGYGLTKIVLD
jgi:hypothetical protein